MLCLEDVAEVCHEANRAYCRSMGDDSQPPWDEAPDWQKDSAISGVFAILAKPDTTEEESHANWFARKESEGWVYGPVKDVERKQHPCMLPYDDLPHAQKVKDFLFAAIVRALAPLVESDRRPIGA